MTVLTQGLLFSYVPVTGGGDGIGRIPTMTAATTSGVTMSASSTFSAATPAWEAGDKSLDVSGGDHLWLSAASVNATLNIDLGTAYTIYEYNCCNTTGYQGGMTTGWNFQGANISDYSDAVTIDTRSSVAYNSSFPVCTPIANFTVASPGSYRYYRFVTTQRGGTYSGFVEVQLYS